MNFSRVSQIACLGRLKLRRARRGVGLLSGFGRERDRLGLAFLALPPHARRPPGERERSRMTAQTPWAAAVTQNENHRVEHRWTMQYEQDPGNLKRLFGGLPWKHTSC